MIISSIQRSSHEFKVVNPILHRKAFTLIELLVVMAIIGVLAGILIPVVAGVRKKSKQTVCISNLRQCGVAIKLYMDDNETYVPPDDTMARLLMKKMPTCCPNDTEWSKGCTQQFGLPFIGSYAYTRSVPVWKDAAYQDVAIFSTTNWCGWWISSMAPRHRHRTMQGRKLSYSTRNG